MKKIFIQIAAYRDKELPITIADLLSKAKYPNNLIIGICRQYNPDDGFDNIDQYRTDTRFKIIDVHYKKTGGVCWARNLIQQLYTDEAYTLQLDSHHRFVKNWDSKLIKMIKDLQLNGYKKPLLTAYLPAYNPNHDPQLRVREPWKMDFDRFIPEGAIFFKPGAIPNYKDLTLPVRGRFYSAHFCFTLGLFCKEVQHNPDYLFHGEEISIAARAYTFGYDIFHPHQIIAWHEYSRQYRPQVWGDDPIWELKNQASHLINRKFFGMDGLTQEGHDGAYGFGDVRTLRDYEKYSGILFAKRAVQQETLDYVTPPNSHIENTSEWEKSFLPIYKHCIDLAHHLTPETDYDFWVVALHDSENNTIYRKDKTEFEINQLLLDTDKYSKIWIEFNADKLPNYWVVWPHSKTKGWCERITGNL